MEKWSLEASPTDADPSRHVLRLKGEMTDIVLIVKKFGAICGRPDRGPLEGGYNFKVALNRTSPALLEGLSALLQELAPPPPPQVSAPPEPAPSEAPAAAPEPVLPEIKLQAPPPAQITLAPPPPAVSAPPVPLPPTQLPPPAAEPPLAQALPEPARPAAEPLPPTELAPAPAPAGRPLWGLARVLDEKRNFEGLLVGSYNRFAHAAATSIVGSPGTMYNPLFIHGGPGVGKTHMLHAIGGGLSKSLGAESVLMTSGTRLSTASALAALEGRFAEIEAACAQKKCLLVDDIHLLAASEANAGPLAKLFAGFLGKSLQIVLTSLYPPRALGALEEALKFSFSRGSAVEMKVPGPEPQKEMLMAGFTRLGLDLNNDENAIFHEKLGSNFYESGRWVRRLIAFKRLREGPGKTVQLGDLAAELLAPVVVEPGSELPKPADLEALKTFSPPPPGAGARALAILFPKDSEALAQWMTARFYKAASELGLSQTYRHALTAPYDPEQPFGVPFQLGEMCRASGAEAALILGPAAQSKLSERAAEFSHAVKHILAEGDVVSGWVGHAATTSAVPYIQANLDFAAQWSLTPCD